MVRVFGGIWLGVLALGAAWPAVGGEWTVLAYLSGDGSLEPVALDYARRLSLTPGTEHVSVAIQIDRGPGFESEAGHFEDTRRAVLVGTTGQTPRPWRWSDWRAEVNMGDPGTLVEFLAWGARAAPAKRYVVLLVGHGSGVRPFVEEAQRTDHGVAYDATSAGDSLTPGEFGVVGPAIIEALGGRRVALLAVDACFSASAEMAAEAAEFADVMTGSPNLLYEPGVPWDVVLQGLCQSPGASAEQIAGLAVEAAGATQALNGQAHGSYAAARLDGVGTLETRLEALSGALCGRMPEAAPAVTAARARSSRGGLSEEMLDLRGFLRALRDEAARGGLGDIEAHTTAAGEALDAMVLASCAGTAVEAGGEGWTWSVFCPPNLTEFPADYMRTGRFARESGWGSFLEAYLGHLQRLMWGA